MSRKFFVPNLFITYRTYIYVPCLEYTKLTLLNSSYKDWTNDIVVKAIARPVFTAEFCGFPHFVWSTNYVWMLFLSVSCMCEDFSDTGFIPKLNNIKQLHRSIGSSIFRSEFYCIHTYINNTFVHIYYIIFKDN